MFKTSDIYVGLVVFEFHNNISVKATVLLEPGGKFSLYMFGQNQFDKPKTARQLADFLNKNNFVKNIIKVKFVLSPKGYSFDVAEYELNEFSGMGALENYLDEELSEYRNGEGGYEWKIIGGEEQCEEFFKNKFKNT